MSVKAEITAVEALRAYLLRTLPAKVDSINAERAAVLKAARAGPYTVAGAKRLRLGTTIGSVDATVTLTEGVRSAQEIADEINAALVPGAAFSADAQGRLVMTATAAPAEGSPSVLYLAPDTDADGGNALFGWNPGGHEVVVSALVAPDYGGIMDGEPEVVDVGAGFGVVIGRRTTTPRENIRSDVHRVQLSLEVYTAEPNQRVQASHELNAQAVRAIREVILADRTLDHAVFLTELPNVQFEARTFRFATEAGMSPLYSGAPMTVLIHVFERS